MTCKLRPEDKRASAASGLSVQARTGQQTGGGGRWACGGKCGSAARLTGDLIKRLFFLKRKSAYSIISNFFYRHQEDRHFKVIITAKKS